MTQDATAPATKEDVRLLMEEIGKLYVANEGWKEELKRYFDVVAENIRHDAYHGALADKIARHEDRIVALERR